MVFSSVPERDRGRETCMSCAKQPMRNRLERSTLGKARSSHFVPLHAKLALFFLSYPLVELSVSCGQDYHFLWAKLYIVVQNDVLSWPVWAIILLRFPYMICFILIDAFTCRFSGNLQEIKATVGKGKKNQKPKKPSCSSLLLFNPLQPMKHRISG